MTRAGFPTADEAVCGHERPLPALFDGEEWRCELAGGHDGRHWARQASGGCSWDDDWPTAEDLAEDDRRFGPVGT